MKLPKFILASVGSGEVETEASREKLPSLIKTYGPIEYTSFDYTGKWNAINNQVTSFSQKPRRVFRLWSGVRRLFRGRR